MCQTQNINQHDTFTETETFIGKKGSIGEAIIQHQSVNISQKPSETDYVRKNCINQHQNDQSSQMRVFFEQLMRKINPDLEAHKSTSRVKGKQE